ncbi:hypothetical protein D9V84_08735 [Bacteroidetes/Chlorobi group bacterium Naka2016]|jgi:hypothetical protein|nr:MAG: hypothetical protein D9V84_08735 [Bacteroidetes/Chlorobi group bacterium Naka2016]
MKIVIIVYLFLIFSFYCLFGQSVETLLPQPRCSYERNEYSTNFAIQKNTKILLNSAKPEFFAAYRLNSELRKRNIDTLDIEFWNGNDTLLNGIALGILDSYLNNLLIRIEQKNITVNKYYPGKEGYILDVTPQQIVINGCDSAGLIYGIVTLMQLVINNKSPQIKPCRIVDAPQYPIRWFYYPMNILVPSNTTKAKQIWEEATNYRLNGVNLTDYKFSFISKQPKNYFDSLQSLKDFANHHFLEIIPGVMPFGYSNSILYWDPSLASGLPVYNQKFVIEKDTARLIPYVKSYLTNPGFEVFNGNNFTGFGYIDQPGQLSFVDTVVKHSGKASIRFSNFESVPGYKNARIIHKIVTKPYTLFNASAWVRSENLQYSSAFQITAINSKGRQLCFINLTLPRTTNGWQKYDVTFNSLDSDTLNVYWGVWGATSGSFWLDDLVLEEVPFVNLIRRSGAPLTVSHPILDVLYKEGIDFDSLYDAKLGAVYSWYGEYDAWHQPPTFRIKSGGRLRNGDTILISYYHTTYIYDGQVMISTTEPKTYEIIEREFKILDSLLKPRTYFMNHDEIRIMNWDWGDQQYGTTPAMLLARNVNKCVDIIKKYNSNASIWVWSDMFDEFHNAKPGNKNYYLVNGELAGVSDSIPKSVGIVNWNHGNNAVQSLTFFENKGFRQITAPYYDTDEQHIRRSKNNAKSISNFDGMMYTTWTNNYSYLKHFGYLAWNHSPFIYHRPLTQIPDSRLINLEYKVSKGIYDSSQIESFKLYYRTSPNNDFSSIDLKHTLNENGVGNYLLKLDSNTYFLEYYFEAINSDGWTTKVPFGDTVYYKLTKEVSSSVRNDDIFATKLSISFEKSNVIKILNFPKDFKDFKIKIFNFLGQQLNFSYEIKGNSILSNIIINLNEFTNGVCFLVISDGTSVYFSKALLIK